MHIFFGDAHFGNRYSKREDERIRRFIKFLNRLDRRVHEIFIIGDLFEFWFEYRSVIPKHYYPVLKGLSQLVDRGIKVNYFLGNHEFGDGGFLTTLGINVYFGESIFNLAGMKVLVGHGDSADDAFATRFMNFLFRSRFNQFLYRLIHPDLGIALAKCIARGSREKSKMHDSSCKLEDYAYDKLKEKDIDIVVFGHSHIPALKSYNKKYYLNVGDLLEHFTFGLIDRGKISLEKIEW